MKKNNSRRMKKAGRLLSLMMAAVMALGTLTVSVSAADVELPTNVRAYPSAFHNRELKRIWVFYDEALTDRSEAQWVGLEEVKVLEFAFEHGSVLIEYNTPNGKKMKRWTDLRIIFPTTDPNCFQKMIAQDNIDTYKNPGCDDRYGSVSAGDICWVCTTPQSSGENYRVIYPLSNGGYKAGWIDDLSAFNKAVNTAPEVSGTSMIVTLSNPNNTLRVRSGPGTGYSVLARVRHGDRVQVLSDSNGWAKVELSNGQMGYVSSSYLTSAPSEGSVPVQNTNLVSPVPEGVKFSRKTNDNGWNGYHDINRNVSASTPVYAVTDGVAEFYQYHSNGKLRSYGNSVRFVSSDGQLEVRYAHLSRFDGVSTPITADSAYPCSGAKSKELVAVRNVSAGDVLGFIGSTGNSSGLHLHIEVYKNGKRVDPTTIFPGLI